MGSPQVPSTEGGSKSPTIIVWEETLTPGAVGGASL